MFCQLRRVNPSKNNIVFEHKNVPGTGLQAHSQTGLMGFKDPLLTVTGMKPGRKERYPFVQSHAGKLAPGTGLPIRPAFQGDAEDPVDAVPDGFERSVFLGLVDHSLVYPDEFWQATVKPSGPM